MSIIQQETKKRFSFWANAIDIKSPPDEYTEMRHYAGYALFNVWGLMSGAAMITTLALIAKGGNVIWTLAAALVAYAVLFAVGYWMWHRERQGKINLNTNIAQQLDTKQKEIEKLEVDSRPNITGWFEDFGIIDWRETDKGVAFPIYDGKYLGLIITLFVALVNRSAIPTTLNHFSLMVRDANGNEFRSTSTEFPTGHYDSETQDNEFDDLEMFLINPNEQARQGIQVKGWMSFCVPKLTIEDTGSVLDFEMAIEDSFGEGHIINTWRYRPHKSRI